MKSEEEIQIARLVLGVENGQTPAVRNECATPPQNHHPQMPLHRRSH